MPEPKMYICERSKAARIKLVSEVAEDLRIRSQSTGETAEEIVSMSIIATLLNSFSSHRDMDMMIENVEDFIAAYNLIRYRTQILASNN